MKNRIALILFLLFILSLQGCAVQTESPENPYRPISYKSEFFENGIVTSSYLSEYQYDENGFLAGTLEYRDGILNQTYIYENDTFGNILKVTSISDGKTTVFDHKLTLDEHGRVLLQEAYSEDVLFYTLAYTYDKHGNMTSELYTTIEDGAAEVIRSKEMVYNRNGVHVQTILNKMDGSYIRYDYENGKEIKASQYNSNDELLSYQESTYNDHGQLIKEASYTCKTEGDSRTSLLSTYSLYTYDETGLVVTQTNHSVEERPIQTYSVTTYDQYGNKLLQERYMDGQLHWRITQTFELIP